MASLPCGGSFRFNFWFLLNDGGLLRVAYKQIAFGSIFIILLDNSPEYNAQLFYCFAMIIRR
jgi:hypothetical protein